MSGQDPRLPQHSPLVIGAEGLKPSEGRDWGDHSISMEAGGDNAGLIVENIAQTSPTEAEVRAHWNNKLKEAQARAAVEQVTRTIDSKNASAKTLSDARQQEVVQRNHELALQRARSRQSVIWGWLRMIGTILLGLVVIALVALLLFRAYRWCVEAPLIKEVVRKVEVEKPVDRIVERPVEKRVKVIPKECTQIRRNGEIYINCDGVTVKGGAHTVQESGLEKVPELLPDEKP